MDFLFPSPKKEAAFHGSNFGLQVFTAASASSFGKYQYRLTRAFPKRTGEKNKRTTFHRTIKSNDGGAKNETPLFTSSRLWGFELGFGFREKDQPKGKKKKK